MVYLLGILKNKEENDSAFCPTLYYQYKLLFYMYTYFHY